MTTVSFSGLATGLDSGSIIDSLVKAEKAVATRLGQRRSDIQKRISILSDLGTKLRGLGTAAGKVDASSELRALRATATGPELTATGSSDAQAGTWTVAVRQLARAETSRSRAFASRDPGVVGDGSVAIAVGGAAPVTVTYGAADSLDAIAARINDEVDGVTASVLDTGSELRLLISSEATGTASGLSFSETGDGLGITESVAARDAIVEVSGTTVTRATNTLTDVIPGVRLDLTAVTAADSDGAVVSVTRDPDAQRGQVQALVDAYNDVAKVLAGQLAYSGVQRGEDTFFGDVTLRGLQARLTRSWTEARPSGATQVTARDLGITLNGDGTIALDAAAFDAAAAADPQKVADLLAGEGGLAATLDGIVEEMTLSGTGVLAAKESGLRSRSRSFDDQIARIEDAADALGERLRRQFTQLEQAVAGMQSNLTYLSALFTTTR